MRSEQKLVPTSFLSTTVVRRDGGGGEEGVARRPCAYTVYNIEKIGFGSTPLSEEYLGSFLRTLANATE